MMHDFAGLEKQVREGGAVKVPGYVKDWLHHPKPLFIGGKKTLGKEGRTFETFSPSTGEVLARVAEACREDIDHAVKSARATFESGTWSKQSLVERAACLEKMADLILLHKPVLALLESLDTGKPIRESLDGDIPRAASNFRFFADFAKQEAGETYSSDSALHSAIREPLGVVALITPWNLPLYLESWKLAPALVMGNSVVLKPSELTPLTAAYLVDLVVEAGIPDGVFNLVHGFGENAAGEFLVSHPGVDAISFTGETGTGRAIMKSAAVGPTRVSFELGGKGASVVFADADLALAAKESARAAFRNQGEICLACPRLFVEKSVFEKFKEMFFAEVDKIRLGDPLDYATTMGALISRDHLEKVRGFVTKASHGGSVLRGGKTPTGFEKGFYLEPTVIAGLGHEHPISQNEIFGPVVSLYPFESEEEVVRAVNGTQYGLSASIWTLNTDRAYRVSRAIRAGLIWVNCWFVRDLRVPFGGMKRSGLGREGGKHSLDFYSEWKSVCESVGGGK